MENIQERAKRIQREYHKKWRANNRDKVKEINQRYWLNKAQKQK